MLTRIWHGRASKEKVKFTFFSLMALLSELIEQDSSKNHMIVPDGYNIGMRQPFILSRMSDTKP